MWCSSARLDELLNEKLEEQLKDQLGDQLEVQLDDEDNLQRRKVFSRGLGSRNSAPDARPRYAEGAYY